MQYRSIAKRLCHAPSSISGELRCAPVKSNVCDVNPVYLQVQYSRRLHPLIERGQEARHHSQQRGQVRPGMHCKKAHYLIAGAANKWF